MKHIIFVGDKPSSHMKFGAKAFEGAKCETRLKSWIKYVCDSTMFIKIWNRIDPAIWFIWAQDDRAVFVALGNNASNFLIKNGILHFKLPHPSGRNRQLNNKEFVDKALKDCYNYVRTNL